MADRYDRRLGAAALREDPGLCRPGRACGLCHVARDPAFKKGIRDLAPFLWAWLVEQAAFHVGEWESIFEIRRAEKCLQVRRA